MPNQSKNHAAAMAVAASGCLCITTSFVAPGGLGSGPALRGADAAQLSATTATRAAGSATPTFGLAASGAVLAVAGALIRNRRPKVDRRFFGGDSGPSYKSFDPATELGVQDPLGFWDPMGFCEDGDEAAFKRRRTVEIKHGRISMYACIGYIVPEYYKFPGYLSPSEGLTFEDVPNGLAALSKLPLLGGAQIIAFAGVIETTGFFSGKSTDGRGPRGLGQMKDSTEEAEPGNYGIGFPNFVGKVDDPEARKSKLAAELANGRLAMVAIIGMFFQDGLTGSAWGDWALYTDSPLRAEPVSAAAAAAAAAAGKAAGAAGAAKAAGAAAAGKGAAGAAAGAKATGASVGAGAGTAGSVSGKNLESQGPDGKFDPTVQPGAMAPLGFFDPLGYCPPGNEANFRNLRAAEIKHGRVAMMASVGAVAQHYIQFPGFEKVPAGLAAVVTPPGTYGFAALFAVTGLLEIGAWVEDPSKEPGNFGDPVGLGQYDIDTRNKEINNGRMAMFASLGIIAADLLTGKDGIQQLGL